MYTITSHVKDHLSGGRNFLKQSTLEQLVRLVAPQLDKVDPRRNHQVAVVLAEPGRKLTVGNTHGDRLIIAVDIRQRTVCSIFARWKRQGKPRACQVMIDLDGNVVA
jgi:hypothetical protein